MKTLVCIIALTVPAASLAVAQTPAQSSGAQSSGAIALLAAPVDAPMIAYTTLGRTTAIGPADVFEIEISSSGGLTDIFVRLAPTAGATLEDMTTLAEGEPMLLSLCGREVYGEDALVPNSNSALYIPNLTFVQADALRSVWHGRETCATLDPEVFSIGQ